MRVDIGELADPTTSRPISRQTMKAVEAICARCNVPFDGLEEEILLARDAAKSFTGRQDKLARTNLLKLMSELYGDKWNPSAPAHFQAQSDTADPRFVALRKFGLCPRPPGAVKRPERSLAFSYENPFCMGVLYGRAG